MKLLTDKIRRRLPPLYSTEKVPDPVAQAKFFTPDSGWSWFTIEFDGEDTFFGLVVGHEVELGCFSLGELEETTGPWGLHVERDMWFQPTPLSKIRAELRMA